MKKVLIFFCSVLVILPNLLSVRANAAYNTELASYAPQIFYLVNMDTDTVVFCKNENQTCAPASFVKAVTAILALEFFDNLTQKVTVSQNAVGLLSGTGSTVINLLPGEKVPMRDLLYALLLPGANDAANVIAETIGKDIPTFINLMNDFAKAMGCTDTHFVNAHGLDAEGQVTTAHDMYLIFKHALGNTVFKEMLGKYGYTMPATNKCAARNLYSRNPQVNSYSPYYYKYTRGGITGSTPLSGNCLLSFAQKNGYTYICVAMKGENKVIGSNPEARNAAYVATKEMMGWAFENMRLKIVAEASRIVDEIPVKYGKDTDHIALSPEKEITALVPVNAEASGLSIVADSKPDSLTAPVKKGQIVSKAGVYYAGELVAEINLVAVNDVSFSEKEAVIGSIKSFLYSKPFLAILGLFAFATVIFALLVYSSGRRKRLKNAAKRARQEGSTVVTDYTK